LNEKRLLHQCGLTDSLSAIGMFKPAAQEITERLRSVGVGAFRDEVVHLGDEFVVDCDRQALHA